MSAPLRSLLFVPGDSERKQTKALGTAADALILDLEDSVAPQRLDAARRMVRGLLDARRERTQQLWVRANALSSGKLLDDLVAVMDGAPDGLVLPKITSPAEIAEVDHYLAALEARQGRERGATRLLVIATETPQAVLSLSEPVSLPPRVLGLTWGLEDLSTALGAAGKLEADGTPTFTFQLARSLCLLAAAAAGVQAIDGIHGDFRDREGLERDVARARRDGFTGKLAIHPDQVPIINTAFTPSAADVEQARRIVAAFDSAADAGVVALEGRMLDRPHLALARRILELAGRMTDK